MLSGWEKACDTYKWYRRDVEAGPLTLRIDLWSIDEDDQEWACCFNNSKPERFPASTAEKAMTAAQIFLAGYLRNAARELRKSKSTESE